MFVEVLGNEEVEAMDQGLADDLLLAEVEAALFTAPRVTVGRALSPRMTVDVAEAFDDFYDADDALSFGAFDDPWAEDDDLFADERAEDLFAGDRSLLA